MCRTVGFKPNNEEKRITIPEVMPVEEKEQITDDSGSNLIASTIEYEKKNEEWKKDLLKKLYSEP